MTISVSAMAQAPATQPQRRVIEICFVLDTTGSMAGLIEGAKTKVWSIANQVTRIEPRPQLYVGLVGYRDRGDDYVTKVFDLTEDLDIVYKNLQSFSAAGGGDGPESVNQALTDAVTKMHWNRDPNVTKIIFLTGDAPPHMDYADDVKYQQTCADAVKQDLIINTIQCGTMPATTPIWQEIARLSEGSYVALQQDGGMTAIDTPYDKEIAELNVTANKTVLAYGDRSQQMVVGGKVTFGIGGAGGAGRGGGGGAMFGGPPTTSVALDRGVFNAAQSKTIGTRGDLIDDLRDGTVKLDDIKTEELPEEIRNMTPEQRKAYLDQRIAERAEVQSKIVGLAQKRDEYITAERKRLAEQAGGKDSFDLKVAEIVEKAAAKKK